MHSNSSLLSVPRITTLLVSVLVALCSGSNYVYSAYGPQLGARLGLSHTQQTFVGFSGNMGVYSSGPLLGKLVDAKGPQIPLAVATVLLFFGYLGMKLIFDSGTGIPISSLGLAAIIFCNFLTGVGGAAGTVGAANAVAKSFPEKLRTTTIGLVYSGFGLSAFLFSTIAHGLFPGNTSDLLLMLAIGTSVPMIIGWFIIHPVPLPEADSFTTLESSGDPTIFQQEPDSQTSLLADDELSPSRSLQHTTANRTTSTETRGKILIDASPNISGGALFTTIDFWLLFTIMSLLSGASLMWINNVGSIVQALLAKGSPGYDDAESSKWQSVQVSTISVMNCLGRIFIGIFADYTKTRFGMRRTYCISLVAFLFLGSQIMASQVEDVVHLSKASGMIGFAHGGVFGLFPTIVIEWFGLVHYSENWGFVSFSPLVGGNVFSLAFGKNLDAHSPELSSLECLEGRNCYVSSLRLTIASTFLALVLALYAGYRDRRRALMPKAIVTSEDLVWQRSEE